VRGERGKGGPLAEILCLGLESKEKKTSIFRQAHPVSLDKPIVKVKKVN
jgi:hypothetical protein